MVQCFPNIGPLSVLAKISKHCKYDPNSNKLPNKIPDCSFDDESNTKRCFYSYRSIKNSFDNLL